MCFQICVISGGGRADGSGSVGQDNMSVDGVMEFTAGACVYPAEDGREAVSKSGGRVDFFPPVIG